MTALVKIEPDVSEQHHLWCCDEDVAMCGLDISDLPISDGEGDFKCKTCHDLVEADEDCVICKDIFVITNVQ